MWVITKMRESWGSDLMVTHGILHRIADLPGFVAFVQSTNADAIPLGVGWIAYSVVDRQCEIVVLHSLRREVGVGSALVEAVIAEARAGGCTEVNLITTNDNVEALHFWQKRGFLLTALHVNAMEVSRELKPGIPLVGKHGISIRDELEFSMILV